VFVAFIIELAIGMRHTVIRGLVGCTTFFHISHERHYFRKKVIEHTIRVSTVYEKLSEIFLILLEVSEIDKKNVRKSSCKVPVVLVRL
jgi:hypothetical protein